jgi:hypothetical protein
LIEGAGSERIGSNADLVVGGPLNRFTTFPLEYQLGPAFRSRRFEEYAMSDRRPFALAADTERSLARIARTLGKSEGATLDAAVRVLEDIVVKRKLELRAAVDGAGAAKPEPLSTRS